MHRARKVGRLVRRLSLTVEAEAAVDDPDGRVIEACRDVGRRDEELRAREPAHRHNLAVLRGNLRRGLALVRRRTPRGPALAVTLYERPGCHLCEESYRALRRIGFDRPLEITRIDIATDAALEHRYVVRIPVLTALGNELDAAGLDDRRLAAWLDAVRGPVRPEKGS